MRTAFIGLGIMGSRMAQNLLKNDVALIEFYGQQDRACRRHR